MADIEIPENGARVSASHADRIVLRLPENATTGYEWALDDPPDAVEIEENELVPPSSAAPGAAGERRIVLRARHPGTAHVRLVLRRPWEAAAPPRGTFEAVIDVS